MVKIFEVEKDVFPVQLPQALEVLAGSCQLLATQCVCIPLRKQICAKLIKNSRVSAEPKEREGNAHLSYSLNISFTNQKDNAVSILNVKSFETLLVALCNHCLWSTCFFPLLL